MHLRHVPANPHTVLNGRRLRAGRWLPAIATAAAVGVVSMLFGLPGNPAGATGPASPTWTQAHPTTNPGKIDSPGLAYDPANGGLVFFGGFQPGGKTVSTTWTWNGTNWTKLHPSTTPTPVGAPAMAYDPSTRSVVLFSGYEDTTSVHTSISTMWTWNGTNWTKLHPATTPPARTFSSLVYDPTIGELVLFGGYRQVTGAPLGTTWGWNGTNWTKIATTTSPPARAESAMAYDPATGTIILFGGYGTTATKHTTTTLADTWAFNGTNWTQVHPHTSPSARDGQVMGYDAASASVVLFGGIVHGKTVLSDTWSWNGTTWTKLAPATSPPARWTTSMALDPANGTLVLYGGQNLHPTYFSDTWTFPAATGYDLVGQDGGVFVFDATGQTGGFFGSLPGMKVTPNLPVVGMVPTVSNLGYFLVAQDGGVFAFGTAPFLGSLPGIKVTPNQPIDGIVAANTDRGYFLVGRDGGVYAFGTVPFLGSLPGMHVTTTDVVGIAATPSGNGYWVVLGTGTVYGFGSAKQLGSVTSPTSPVSAIAGTPTGGGYWIATQTGGVYPFGNAQKLGTQTLRHIGVRPALPVVGIVHTAGTAGYWLLGSDGGIFAFGTAPFYGSLPKLGVHVTDIVGAVPN
jgi:hypothetical protein